MTEAESVETSVEQPEKPKYPYVCAVRRDPYLSHEVRRVRSEKRLKRVLAAAVTVMDWRKNDNRGLGEWKLADDGQRFEAARRAESPVVGERWQAKVLPRELERLKAAGDTETAEQLAADGQDVLYCESRNNVDRWQKRRARQNGGPCARRRRRGWK